MTPNTRTYKNLEKVLEIFPEIEKIIRTYPASRISKQISLEINEEPPEFDFERKDKTPHSEEIIKSFEDHVEQWIRNSSKEELEEIPYTLLFDEIFCELEFVKLENRFNRDYLKALYDEKINLEAGEELTEHLEYESEREDYILERYYFKELKKLGRKDEITPFERVKTLAEQQETLANEETQKKSRGR